MKASMTSPGRHSPRRLGGLAGAACARLRTRRTPMKSLVIAGLLSALLIGRVNAQVYYTYPEWDRLSDQARTMYIAGAYDSLVSIASPDTMSISRHYSKCVSGRVPIEQLAKNVRTFVAARPDLQKKPVQVGLINYLIELFGAAPQLGRRFFGSACPRGDCRPPGNPRAADTLAGGLTSTSLKMG